MPVPTFTTERLGDGTIKEFTITMEQPFVTVWDQALACLALLFLYHYVRCVCVSLVKVSVLCHVVSRCIS
jgi:hypothetical protein